MALRGEIVDFMRPDLLDKPNEIRAVRHVAIVKMKIRLALLGEQKKVVDPCRVEGTGPTLRALALISLGQQQLPQICAVRAGSPTFFCSPSKARRIFIF